MTQAPKPDTRGLPISLQDGENIIGLYRRHWLHFWPRILLMSVAAVTPAALVAWLLSAADAYEGTVAKVFWVAAGLYLAYWAIRMLLTWYRYQNDVWVVTNQRLIDSIKRNPFSLTVSTADLVSLQDMTVSRHGLLRTIFNFGDVICETAGGDQQEFLISAIPRPAEVQALVDRERDRERMRIRGSGL